METLTPDTRATDESATDRRLTARVAELSLEEKVR
jgi:hypothetical protein